MVDLPDCSSPVLRPSPAVASIAAYDADTGDFLWYFRGGCAMPFGEHVFASCSPVAKISEDGVTETTDVILGDGTPYVSLGSPRVAPINTDLVSVLDGKTVLINARSGVVYADAFDGLSWSSAVIPATISAASIVRSSVDDCFLVADGGTKLYRVVAGGDESVSVTGTGSVDSSLNSSQNGFNGSLRFAVHSSGVMAFVQGSGLVRVKTFGSPGSEVDLSASGSVLPRLVAVDGDGRVYGQYLTSDVVASSPPYTSTGTWTPPGSVRHIQVNGDGNLLVATTQPKLILLDSGFSEVWSTAALAGSTKSTVRVAPCGSDWVVLLEDGGLGQMLRVSGDDGSVTWSRSPVPVLHAFYNAATNQIILTSGGETQPLVNFQ